MYQPNFQTGKSSQTFLRYALTALVVFSSLWAMQARAALDMFLVIDGIEGESKDAQFPDSIDLLAWSWGLANSSSAQGSGAGKTTVQDLSFTQYIDKATPYLIMNSFTGKHVPEAKVIVRTAGERPFVYLTITMEDVLVTSSSTGGSGGEDRLTNNVTLNFGRVCVSYTEQDAQGRPGDIHEACWNVATNKTY